MQIYGTTHVHAAQPIAPPHRLNSAPPAHEAAGANGVDHLDLSPEIEMVAQAHDLPEIREDRVAAIRAQIASGTYETPEKLDIALSRLLDEIA
jgi:negative regulator of flagellin synthesis FlgM